MKPIQGFLTLFFVLLCWGCDKPVSNPETLDPIYEDLNKSAEEMKKASESEKAAYAGYLNDLKAAKQQTGQVSFAQKRLRESRERLNHLEQMEKYWEIRAESRRDFDRVNYAKSRTSKTPWPDPKEYEDYKLAQKAQNQKKNWDVKARMVEAGVAPKAEKKKEGEEAAPPKEEAPKKE
jgi:hypothetical protein